MGILMERNSIVSISISKKSFFKSPFYQGLLMLQSCVSFNDATVALFFSCGSSSISLVRLAYLVLLQITLERFRSAELRYAVVTGIFCIFRGAQRNFLDILSVGSQKVKFIVPQGVLNPTVPLSTSYDALGRHSTVKRTGRWRTFCFLKAPAFQI